MVVKNVAGLDMAKLMIGSFGTLAAIAVVNFKVQPMPEVERSFLLPFDSLAAAIAARNADPEGPVAAGRHRPAEPGCRPDAWASPPGCWPLRAGGNAAAVERYEHEFAHLTDGLAFEDERQQTLWRHVENFTPRFLAAHEDGAVVRASCTLKDSEAVMAVVPRSGGGARGLGRLLWLFRTIAGRRGLVEQRRSRPVARQSSSSRPTSSRRTLDLWPSPGGDFEIMKRVKHLFDPGNLLNRGRLYRLI